MIAIRMTNPEAKIVVLTTFEGDVEIHRAPKAGASGYMLKSTPPDQLVQAIRDVHAGKKGIPATVAAQLAELRPELLALVGEFVPAFAPYRAAFAGRLLEAPDAETMGPLLAERLKGDELVVLKGSRGVTLERILPAILPRAATTA